MLCSVFELLDGVLMLALLLSESDGVGSLGLLLLRLRSGKRLGSSGDAASSSSGSLGFSLPSEFSGGLLLPSHLVVDQVEARLGLRELPFGSVVCVF